MAIKHVSACNKEVKRIARSFVKYIRGHYPGTLGITHIFLDENSRFIPTIFRTDIQNVKHDLHILCSTFFWHSYIESRGLCYLLSTCDSGPKKNTCDTFRSFRPSVSQWFHLCSKQIQKATTKLIQTLKCVWCLVLFGQKAISLFQLLLFLRCCWYPEYAHTELALPDTLTQINASL